MKRLKLPLSEKDIRGVNSGESLLLSGRLYTARDAAHKILADLIRKKKKLPVRLKGGTIYYAGPTPASPGQVIGACGPTTSARMDVFTPDLLRSGLKVMIGKGRRSKDVKKAIKKHKAVYLLAPAGCGALLSRKVIKKRIVAYKELGPEAVFELDVADFPVTVGVDSRGKDIFEKKQA